MIFSNYRGLSLIVFLVFSLGLVRGADNILFIGNSYTQGAMSLAAKNGGVPEMFAEIARAKGRQVNTDALVKGGQHWAYFLARPETDAKLAAMPWTWVVLQNFSDSPVTEPDTMQKDGATFYDRIVKASPAAKIALYETWPRPPAFYHGDATRSQAMMDTVHAQYAKLQATLAARSTTNEVRLAPVGTAFWSLESKGTNLHAGDNHHATIDGYYLAALVIYETIYRDNATGAPTTFFGGKVTIPDAEAKVLQQTADAVATGK